MFFSHTPAARPVVEQIAMEALINVASGGVETKIIKFANTFKGMIKTNTDGSLLADVARALGHLARASAAPNNDYVEFEVGQRTRRSP